MSREMDFRHKETYFNIWLEERARRADLGDALKEIDEPLTGDIIGYEEQFEKTQLKAQYSDVIHIAPTGSHLSASSCGP
jgi:hypothetical protein